MIALRSLFNIYNSSFRVSVLQASQYRAYLAIWILSLVAEPIVYMNVWTLVTRESGGAVAGFTSSQLAAYYITWMLVRHFAVTLAPEAVAFRIRQGEISGLMLRPVHPIHTDIGENIGFKLVATPIILLAMLGLALLFRPVWNPPIWALLAFIPAMLMAYLIRFIAHYILGLLAFWMNRVSSITGLFEVAEIFLTGRFAPMALLPAPLVLLATVLPFRWMVSFPVEILLGQLTVAEVLQGYLFQAFWLGIMILSVRMVWGLGVRHYGAVGG